ncbi:MAG: tetratricopeptide repeat protein, partial [Ketobacter sp.]|nr:tetratricopeptide repeat protein [Ketobacter sp.]
VIFEHRLYLPLAGFSLVIVAFMGRAFFQSGNLEWAKRCRRNASLGLIGLVILLLMAGAYKRNFVWMDDETLWSDVTAKSNGKARGHYNLGLAYALKGKHDQALSAYGEALRISPKKVEALHNIGVVYFEQGKTEQAVNQYQKALRIQPDYADAHFNLGVALAKQGNEKEALAHYMKVLELKPGYAEAHNNLAVYYFYKKDFTQAAHHLEQALAQGFAVHPEFVKLMEPFMKRGK